MLPLSKLPVFAVAVCTALPLFTHVTVSPALIVIFCGENALSVIRIVACAAKLVCGRKRANAANKAAADNEKRKAYCMDTLLHAQRSPQLMNSQQNSSLYAHQESDLGRPCIRRSLYH